MIGKGRLDEVILVPSALVRGATDAVWTVFVQKRFGANVNRREWLEDPKTIESRSSRIGRVASPALLRAESVDSRIVTYWAC